MGRGGFVAEHLAEKLKKLDLLVNLEVEGIGSHLPSADEDEEFTLRQFAQFHAIIDDLGGEARFKWRHLSNSAGLLGYAQGCCNLSRPGLMLYGVSALAGFQARLSTVMTLKSRVTLVRTLPAGHGISYGRQFVTTKPTRVATIGVGYGDGYPIHVSGKAADVWIRGRRMPILGRVTMDQIMVDVTAAEEVVEGDEVEIFGPNIPVAEIAEKAESIVWEIFTGITPRVLRCYF
jgi:alanine racemase